MLLNCRRHHIHNVILWKSLNCRMTILLLVLIIQYIWIYVLITVMRDSFNIIFNFCRTNILHTHSWILTFSKNKTHLSYGTRFVYNLCHNSDPDTSSCLEIVREHIKIVQFSLSILQMLRMFVLGFCCTFFLSY